MRPPLRGAEFLGATAEAELAGVTNHRNCSAAGRAPSAPPGGKGLSGGHVMHRLGYCLPVIVLFAVFGSGVAEAQLRFKAEYLLWNRNNDSDATILSGGGGFSADEADFGYASGYQFTLGGSSDLLDVEASFLQIPDWSDSWSGTLVNPLAFDDPTNVNIAPANGLGFVSALSTAANLAGVEDNEIEFLEAGAQFQSRYESTFDSFELNIGSSRTVRPVFFSLGWRHMELDESAATLLRGNFQVMDADDGALPGSGTDEANNQLSHAALLAAGFTHTAGAGDGFAGYDPTLVPPVITELGVSYQGTAYNDLDGMQLTVGGRYTASEIVSLQAFLKGGVYQNHSQATIRESVFGIVNDGSAYERTFRDGRRSASFGGAAGFDVIIAVTDFINFTLGYQGLFVTNMALAADQSSGISTDLFGATRYNIVNDAVFIAHGANVGLELTW